MTVQFFSKLRSLENFKIIFENIAYKERHKNSYVYMSSLPYTKFDGIIIKI